MFEQRCYHGTLQHKAVRILREPFFVSKKNTEWLGHGIYFFEDVEWAKTWAIQEYKKNKYFNAKPTIVSALIRCEDAEFYDLDIRENMLAMEREAIDSLKQFGSLGRTRLTKHELKCFACNYWRAIKGIKVFAYTFPILKDNFIGFPVNHEQRQFCVVNNDYIFDKQIEEIEEGFDYDAI